MKFIKKFILLILLISISVVISGCKGECKFDVDCQKEHFTAKCLDKKCVFEPKKGECGNTLCEKEYQENECTCNDDCGKCQGQVGKYLTKKCINDECTGDLPFEKQVPLVFSTDATNAGDKIRVITQFNSPFNLKKDLINLKFSLSQKNNFNHVLKNIELTGVSPEKRTLVLGQKNINKKIEDVGKEFEVEEELKLDFPIKLLEGEFKDLELVFSIDYDVKSGSKFFPKSANIKNKYKDINLLWVKPEAKYDCPECKQRVGFQTKCSEETNYFCEYTPLTGVCGNLICDVNENKCICQKDCGICKGELNFLQAGCVNNNCIFSLKKTILQETINKLDDRKIGAFSMLNNYKYIKPFNIKKDKFVLNFALTEQKLDVSQVKIETVRLLEGSEQIALSQVNKNLEKNKPLNIETQISDASLKEEDKSLSLRVDYSYIKASQTERGSYTYTLEKITILNPD